MRIISGTARGRNLFTLKGLHTRPTADRVKEAVFSVLATRLPGALVLDAFGGSGALALEALSRGAQQAWLCEAEHQAAEVCRRNIELCSFDNCRLLRGDVLKLLPRLRQEQPQLAFDLIFADPPYNRGWLPRLAAVIEQGGWLADQGLLIAETTAHDSEFAPLAPWQVEKRSVYGQTAVCYCSLQHLA